MLKKDEKLVSLNLGFNKEINNTHNGKMSPRKKKASCSAAGDIDSSKNISLYDSVLFCTITLCWRV